MHNTIETMLKKYPCQSTDDYINALKEIFQEIALLALWRSKFFEHAAFYGGTALRILYGLDRFSEDLDFSLLSPKKNFRFKLYYDAIVTELSAFGFEVEMLTKEKTIKTNIESAFIKANTIKQLFTIEAMPIKRFNIHRMHSLKIKMEVDVNPPPHFRTEAKILLLPLPFSILTYSQPDLFAGKIHALLCREWKNHIKGRDWYDYVWFISHGIPVHLIHLQSRLHQSNHLAHNTKLSKEKLLQLLSDKIHTIDFSLAKKDVIHFIKNKQSLDMWSTQFFIDITKKLITI